MFLFVGDAGGVGGGGGGGSRVVSKVKCYYSLFFIVSKIVTILL